VGYVSGLVDSRSAFVCSRRAKIARPRYGELVPGCDEERTLMRRNCSACTPAALVFPGRRRRGKNALMGGYTGPEEER
jgi:hypothetical protein